MSAVHSFTVGTERREELVDITSQVAAAVAGSGIADGIALIFCPHTTGAITIQESADPDVPLDLTTILRRLVPQSGDYRHAEGNSDAHAKSALLGSTQTLFVQDGQLLLGTWQGIFFCEFDGPRKRKVWVKLLADPR